MNISTNHFSLYFVLIAILLFGKSANAQQNSSLRGTVNSAAGVPLSGAGISIISLKKSAVSDHNGFFEIDNVPPGSYKIMVTYVGYIESTLNVILPLTVGKDLRISLQEIENDLSGITVVGRTKAQEVNRQAFNVTAIDATKLYNTTLDISGALDRVAGVRVRESGGVGSNFNVSLNGFSGRHIRYFIDGIPMDNFGSSFQINNIPINVAERVEVYKGVVPMWLGSDALGGAVNIVTGNRHRNYVDASYSYGSFNTHRSVLNTAATSQSGFTVQLSAFQNYSDNNYKTNLRLLLQNNMVPEKRAATVRRFHDVYHNESVIANVGIVGKSWADNLLLGVTLGQNYKEMQTAARPESVYGQYHRRGNIVMPSLKYKKVNLIEGLDLTFNANYNLGYEETIDTAKADYDWDGIRDPKVSIGESNNGGHAKYRNNNGLSTAMLSYKLSEHQSISINNVFSTFNRKTDDLLFPEKNAMDPPKRIDKNVLGFGYGYDVDSKWSINLFGKYIVQKNIIGSINAKDTKQKLGYGTALAYYISPGLQLRTSYELTNRMPEANEVFGDLENVAPSPLLRPEKSDNLNLGVIYGFQVNKINRFSITANAIFRHSTDFIFSRLVGGTSALRDLTISENRSGVRTMGVDGEIRYSFKNWLSAGTTITYQKLTNLQQYDWDANARQYYTTESITYLDQMPNIPYLFGNADVSASFKNVFRKGNNLTLGYNLLYVNSFWLYWPSLGNTSTAGDKNGIPTQFSHDLNFVYSMKNGRYNVSLEARNITDRAVFDNFSLQKPGRGFYLNFRYFINKS
jgi:outer membrane receptor protein involved in Fe transport